jgi:hypothetical protein
MRRFRMKGAGLSDILPITTWGQWSQYPGALAWSASTQAPPPLANGGLYTAAQSTGAWASQPMPATQYGFAVEAAKIAHTPEVFYHQRPNDNSGASYSPIVGTPASPQHYSMTQGPKLVGGKRSGTGKRRRSSTSKRRRSSTKKYRHSK